MGMGMPRRQRLTVIGGVQTRTRPASWPTVGDSTLKKVHPDWPRTIMPMDDGHAFLAPVGSYQAQRFRPG